MQTISPSPTERTDWMAQVGWRMPTLLAALLLGLGGRIAYGYGAPFWFDETFTAVIASEPTAADLLRWCFNELTGPGFYAPLWAWEKLAGSSNLSLRAPSLILAFGTPLAILRWGHRDADMRWWWGLFILLWAPSFASSGEARPYPQIFALGAAQAVLFMRLIECPSTGRAGAWVAVSSLLVLCHYWSVVPGLVQGIAYLAVHRARAVRTWPSLLLMGPMLAWSWFHLPSVLRFTIGSSSGLSGLPLSALLDVPQMLLGVRFGGTVVFAAIGLSLILAWRRSGGRLDFAPTPEVVLTLCGISSIAFCLLLAFLRPGFAPRYATAATPAMLFGIALWARWTAARDVRPVMITIAVLFATAAGLVVSALRGADIDPRHKFQLETPSAWLAERSPQRLVVFWDGPVAEASPDFVLARVGSFFLRRAGQNPVVVVARATASENPNRRVLATTRDGESSGILWFANDRLPPDRAPQIERYDNRFECKDFGEGVVTMTACRLRH